MLDAVVIIIVVLCIGIALCLWALFWLAAHSRDWDD